MALVAAVALMTGACGGDTLDENLTVDNVTPTGSVGGQVLSAEDDRPMFGATVRVVAGDFTTTATTDSSGLFHITDVPASGPVLVLVEAANHLQAQLVGTFTNAAGDYPVNNATLTLGPIGLEPTGGSFSVWVYDQDGRPAQGHVLSLTTSTRYLLYTTGTPVDQGEITVSATVGTNGLATFAGLPDYWALAGKVNSNVLVTVPPFDSLADDDDFYEYPGGTYPFNVLALTNPQPTIVLTTDFVYPAALEIEASNVQALEGYATNTYVPDTINPVGPIHVLFNTPVEEDSLAIEVWNEDGDVSYGSSAVLNGRSLTIQFPTALPADDTGAEYNILISAVAAAGDRMLYRSWNAAFFVLDPANTDGVSASISRDDPLNPQDGWVTVSFSEPVGFGLPGQTLADTNCVVFYGIDLSGQPGGVTGDDPGEWSNPSCPASFVYSPDEPAPLHPAGAGLSGYTKYWRFQIPMVGPPGFETTMPMGTPIYLAFDHVANNAYIMRRANGEPLPMIELSVP